MACLLHMNEWRRARTARLTDERPGAFWRLMGAMTRREGVFIELVNQAMEKPLAAQPFALHVGGQEVSIAQRWLYFPEYNGPPPKDSRQDQVVGPPNRPFAALQVVERLENEGFVAGWFDGRHKLLSTWEPRRELTPSQSAEAIFARMKVWGKESGGY